MAERRVFFDAREPTSPEEAIAFEAEARRMREALSLRAIELELAAEVRPRLRRELELSVEDPRE